MQELNLNEMIMEKMALDKFFSMFLAKFGNKMDPNKTDTPIWKLYNAKSNEYHKLNASIRATEYALNK